MRNLPNALPVRALEVKNRMAVVKTITCHDVYNAGASLQAYALITHLKSMGCEAEIIHYTPSYLFRYRLFGINNIRYDKPFLRELYQIVKLPSRVKRWMSPRRRAFDRFTATLPLTKRYRSYAELKADPPFADVYFAGSDQIWNTSFPNGKDPSFYLDFVPPGRIRASYAASFATENVDDAWKPQVRQWLEKFDAIGVRESSGVRIINDLGVSGAVHVCDPVFLLPRRHWEEMAVSPLPLEKPYLFVYDFDQNPVIREYCITASKKNNWKIYSLFKNDYSDRCFQQAGPIDFLTLLYGAAFVVSNSYHASVFSLIFEKQFAVFRRKEKINIRMEDLTAYLGIQHVLEPAASSFEPVNYAAVRPLLFQYVDHSKAYIIHVMKKTAAVEKKPPIE